MYIALGEAEVRPIVRKDEQIAAKQQEREREREREK